MTFYEQELRKIVGERYPDATYVGRACYVRLSDMNRAKIQSPASKTPSSCGTASCTGIPSWIPPGCWTGITG